MYIMTSDEMKPVVVEQGCCEKICLTINNQDFGQRVNVNISFIMELYRVVMASFLLMFVPQKCGEELCGIFENLFTSDLNSVGFGVNVATFLSFLAMYSYEIRRENKMITYLHVNDELPRDNDAVDEALNQLGQSSKQEILRLDQNYQRTTYIAIAGFLVNTGLSSVVISKSYLDSKTTTALITNILFMAVKLIDAYGIAHTEKNIFYSAYLKSRLQFNDVDPDKMIDSDAVELTIIYEDAERKEGEEEVAERKEEVVANDASV
jgi:hypothetical protein